MSEGGSVFEAIDRSAAAEKRRGGALYEFVGCVIWVMNREYYTAIFLPCHMVIIDQPSGHGQECVAPAGGTVAQLFFQHLWGGRVPLAVSDYQDIGEQEAPEAEGQGALAPQPKRGVQDIRVFRNRVKVRTAFEGEYEVLLNGVGGPVTIK